MSDATKIIPFKRPVTAKPEAATWPGVGGYARFDRAFAPVAPHPAVPTLQSVPANDVRPH